MWSPGRLLDMNGQATPLFNVPNVPNLGGLTLSAAGITLNPSGPFGLGFVSNGVQTLLVGEVAPGVTAVSPAAGPIAGGAPVTVMGSAFASGASVTLGGSAATGVVVVDSQTITATAPPGVLGPVDVTVTNPSGLNATLAGGFTYIPDLSLTSVAPLIAAPGTTITLTGDGFMPGLSLNVGGMAVVPQSISQTQVTFAMPANVPCNTQILLTNPSTQSASLPFNQGPLVALVVNGVGPVSGGGQVHLLGLRFSPGITVSIGGNPAAITSLTANSIFATVPPGTLGSAPILVTSPSGCPSTCTAPGGCNYLYQ